MCPKATADGLHREETMIASEKERTDCSRKRSAQDDLPAEEMKGGWGGLSTLMSVPLMLFSLLQGSVMVESRFSVCRGHLTPPSCQ